MKDEDRNKEQLLEEIRLLKKNGLELS